MCHQVEKGYCQRQDTVSVTYHLLDGRVVARARRVAGLG